MAFGPADMSGVVLLHMSSVRSSCAPSTFVKNPKKGRKKTPLRQEWDNTIHDLSLHQATTEELVHHHRINNWEVQNKTVKRKKKRRTRGPPEPLAERRYDITRKIICDQCYIEDVSDDPDRPLEVMKDGYSDAPRRRTGHRNGLIASSSDTQRVHRVQKKDLPTHLPILGQDTVNPQAENDSDLLYGHRDPSENEQEESYHPTKRDQQNVHGECSQRHANGGEFVGPPKAAIRFPNVQAGKKKPPVNRHPPQGNEHSGTPTIELPHCSPSNLDILHQMTREVEREMAEYEKQTGRNVLPMPQSPGLTGFTLSLVNSLKRLVCYQKESDMQLRQEILQRQALEGQLNQQRKLINALTADVNTAKRGPAPDPDREEEISKITEVFKHLSMKKLQLPAARSVLPPPGLQHFEWTAEEVDKTPGNGPQPLSWGATEQTAFPLHGYQPTASSSPPLQQKQSLNQSDTLERTVVTVPSSPADVLTFDAANKDSPKTESFLESAVCPPSGYSEVQRWTETQQFEKLGKHTLSLPQSLYPTRDETPEFQDPGEQEIQTGYLETEKEEKERGYTHTSVITSRMAELAKENSALKSYLRQIKLSPDVAEPQEKHTDRRISPDGTKVDREDKASGFTVQVATIFRLTSSLITPPSVLALGLAEDNGSCSQDAGTELAPASLETSTAELYRQREEVRVKLLGLIERQRQCSLFSGLPTE
ncbi:spindle and centriole-associated protein 1 [Pelodytes ibericus]